MAENTSALEALRARLQILEDKQALTELLDQYCKAPDCFDFAGHANTYLEDGTQWYGPWAPIKGRKNIQDTIEKNEKNIQNQIHYMTNMRFEINGDNATGTSYLLMVVIRKGEKPEDGLWQGGPYEWTFKRTADGWRINTMKLKAVWVNKVDPLGIFTTAVRS